MSDPVTSAGCCDAAVRHLEAAGLNGARVAAAGPQGEIAVITLPVASWSRLLHADSAALVSAIKAEGFRHVTLDFDVEPAGE